MRLKNAYMTEAFELRDQLAVDAVNPRRVHPGGDRRQSEAFSKELLRSQVVLWHEDAIKALFEHPPLVSDASATTLEDQMNRLRRAIYSDHAVRDRYILESSEEVHDPTREILIVRPRLLSTFHYFPLHAFDSTPELAGLDPHGTHTQVKAFAFYPYGGATVFAAAECPKWNDSRSGRTIGKQMLRDYHCPLPTDSEWSRDFMTVSMLFSHYQMLDFLLSPVAEIEHSTMKTNRIPQAPSKGKIETKVRVVYLRAKVQLPAIALDRDRTPLGKWHLEFEVNVREHTRRLRDGRVINVRSHRKGPKGVIKARVIKAVR